jgi:beta-lactamase class A
MAGVLLLLSFLLASPSPQAIAAPAGGIVGFAALDLATGRTLALHDNEGFPMASVFKLPVAIAVLHAVDARKLSLGRTVTLTAADARGGKAAVVAAPGRATIGRLLEAMLVDSDNTACDKLLSLVGGPAIVDAQIRKLGVEGIAIRMTEQDMLADKGDNMATPAAMVALLAKVARGELGLSRASARQLDKLLLAVTTGPKRLKAGVPDGTPVAHKTGTSGTTSGVTDATNDAGLLGAGKARIAVAVFVRASPADEATRERVIADFARMAWETFRAPPAQAGGSSK